MYICIKWTLSLGNPRFLKTHKHTMKEYNIILVDFLIIFLMEDKIQA